MSAAGSDRTREFEAAGLLEGLDDGAREARLALLDDLAAEGVSVDEMKQALDEARLALLPVDRALAPRPEYTAEEVGERAGLPAELLLKMRQAAGIASPLPQERSFDDQDVEAARAFARLREWGIPDEDLLEVTRVLGAGIAQAAEAMRMTMARLLLGSGDERETAARNAAATRELLPLVTPLMEYTLRLHIRDQVRNQQFGLLELSEGASPALRHVFVAFVDMVGFTRLGERVEAHELGGLVTRLNDLALETVRPPVRLVKTIGDAAMLVSPAAEPLVETSLALVEAAEDQVEEFPPLRAGLAGGVALSRGGDWYGRPVNLASRVTAVARPASVLATKEVRDAAGDRYSWSRAGRWELKGFRERVPLYRARRAEEVEQVPEPAGSAPR
ncbi:MAG: adenylate cyclase regulatory domain-containing protein [Solirubrobacterales bacterium]